VVDMTSNAAFEVALNVGKGQVEELWLLNGVLEKLSDVFGDEGIGIKTVRQESTESQWTNG